MHALRSLTRLAITLAVFAIALPPAPTRADDTQFWNEFIATMEFPDGFSVLAASEQDFIDDVSRLGLWNVTLEPCYAPLDWLSFGVGYRNEHAWKPDDWRTENRYWLHAGVKHKVAGWNLSLRPKLEFRDKEKDDGWRLRTKFRIQRSVTLGGVAFTPYWSEEPFYDARTHEWNQNRMAVGLRFAVTRSLQLGAYYTHCALKSGDEWDNTHALGTELLASF
jgi:hypothetical protein